MYIIPGAAVEDEDSSVARPDEKVNKKLLLQPLEMNSPGSRNSTSRKRVGSESLSIHSQPGSRYYF